MFQDWPDNLLVLNEDGVIEAVSSRFCLWLGWNKYELLGQVAHKMLCAPARSFKHGKESCPLNFPPGEKEARHGEALIVDHSGVYHHVEYITDELANSKPALTIVRFIDDSKLRHTKNELQRMSYFIDESPFPLAEFSNIGTIEFSNPKMNELILKYGYCDLGQSKLLPNNFYALLSSVISTKKNIDDVVVKTDDGEYWTWYFYYVNFGDEDGVHGIAANISERKQKEIMEQELRHVAEEMKDNARNKALAKLIHEFRSPLNSVVGLASILKKQLSDRLNEKEEKFLNMIEEGGRKLANQITESLQSAKENRLENSVEKTQINTREILLEIEQQLTPLAIKKGLYLKLECDEVALNTDRRKLYQIVVNFIDNAIKYTDTGGVDLIGKIKGGQYIISVQDTGRGLTDEEQKSVYAEFKRMDGVEQIEGTGLGLSVVKGLANLLGAQLSIESELGQGSTFSVSFPL